MSAHYVSLYHVFKFWFLYNHLLEAQFWYQISISQVCNFPLLVVVAIYMPGVEKPTFHCFLDFSHKQMKIH